jgi:hypothetical protein
MSEPMSATLKVFGQSWSRTVTSLVWGQWLLLDTGLRAAETVLGSASAGPRGGVPENLIERAKERMRKGLAPPREIYQAPYRDRIDWGQFPGWARPIDPELFGESPHEG